MSGHVSAKVAHVCRCDEKAGDHMMLPEVSDKRSLMSYTRCKVSQHRGDRHQDRLL